MEQNEKQCVQIADLTATVEKLTETIRKLEEKLNKNSRNSSKPFSTNGMLVKRPLVVNCDNVLVGFNETEWTEKWKT